MKTPGKIIWPLSIRIIHWALVLVIVLNAFILEEGDPPHRYLGYFAFFLVAIRIYFGIKGKGAMHFSQFPIRPSDIKFFLKNHFKRQVDHYEGHNPLASLVYFFIWGAVIALGISGWMMGLDAFWGDERLESLHGSIYDFLMALVLLHILGIVIDAVLYKRKTWMAMIKGHK